MSQLRDDEQAESLSALELLFQGRLLDARREIEELEASVEATTDYLEDNKAISDLEIAKLRYLLAPMEGANSTLQSRLERMEGALRSIESCLTNWEEGADWNLEVQRAIARQALEKEE